MMTRSEASAPHVLLVTPGFPADEDDTPCLPPVQLMLRTLRALRPDVRISVISLHYPSQRLRYRWLGIDVEALGAGNVRWPRRSAFLLRALHVASGLHRRQAISHVHALWLTDAAAVAWWIARAARCRLSITAMGQDVLRSNPYLRLLRRTSAAIVTPSARSAASLAAACGRGADGVIPWGMDRPSHPTPAWEDRSIDLLGVGSLIDLKQWPRLVDTVAGLAAGRPNLRSLLIGDGPLRPFLESEVRARGLAGVLTLAGELPRPRVLEFMEESRILVHPSSFEGQGFVFAEALSRGMAVVSGPVGSAAPSARWLIVEPDGMVDACIALLDDPPSSEPVATVDVEETARAYERLWGLA